MRTGITVECHPAHIPFAVFRVVFVRISRRQKEKIALIYHNGAVIVLQYAAAACTVQYLMPVIAFGPDYMVLIFAATYSRKMNGQLSGFGIIGVDALVYLHIVTFIFCG